MAKNTSVLGIYPDRTSVSSAISVLHKAGFRTEDIAFLAAENQGSKDFAHERGSKAAEGAAAGALLGAIAGGLLGWCVATGRVTAPGLESLALATPVIAALAAAAAAGAVCWLIGSVVGLNMPEYRARRYAGRMASGGILLSIHCDSSEWVGRARTTLLATGARSIGSVRESAGDYASTDKPTLRIPASIDEDTPIHQPGV
ncbi:MAG TPA: hypothetical protein VNH18_33385 [Bryobacteraceae bacterium]|nr:hypothetical protein [Bryobacteraceae bacterium]